MKKIFRHFCFFKYFCSRRQKKLKIKFHVVLALVYIKFDFQKVFEKNGKIIVKKMEGCQIQQTQFTIVISIAQLWFLEMICFVRFSLNIQL